MRWCCVLTVLQAIACQAIPHRGLGEEKAQARRAIDLLALETPSRTSGFPLSPQQSEHEHDRRDITEDAVAATRIVVAETRIVDSGTAFILPPPTREPETTGTVVTTLERDGHPSIVPLLTSPIPEPKTLLEAAETVTSADTMPSPSPQAVVANIFDVPIDTGPLPQTIGTRNTHPIPKQGVKSSGPSQTNKFYANFFLGGQNDPCYAIPYSLSWAKGRGVSGSWGMAISHTNASQRVFGPTNEVGAARYYINPVGIQSMIISAQELRNDTVLTTEALTQSSVKVSLSPNDRSRPAIEFPVVQGMAFVTAIYSGATPVIQTGVFFRSMVRAGKAPKRGVTKYKFTLEDGRTWLLYAYSSQGDSLDLQVLNNNLARAKGPFRGIVQVAKDPGDAEAIYDDSAGAYTTTTKLSGAVLGSSGSYTFTFVKEGMANVKGLMWALPHHVESFDGTTRTGVTKVRLETPTKSIATLVRADSWTMVEPQMPVKIGFAPWSPDRGSVQSLSAATKATLQSIAASEVSQDMQSQTNVNSTYFAGKAFAKFAGIVLTINDLLGNRALAQSGLNKLKSAFARFASNSQHYPLTYETVWGGLTSTATYKTGNTGEDFGNTCYNDHHFHWGYFIYTAAVIGHLDPGWIPANKAWVNAMVRDIANPTTRDPYFPQYRSFDWYAGHSWAHGLFASLDGKNQESSSEDAMHVYAIKMWAQVIGDRNMEARANLNLAVLARALSHYYLYTKNNVDQPAAFIKNKVAGILFENKVDHTTFFGNNIEFIQGIHMLPLLPVTPYTRSKQFVREEWDTYFSNGRVDKIAGGWRGILYGNYATIEPKAAYAWFSSRNFNPAWLDGGASRTWYMAFSAALAGL